MAAKLCAFLVWLVVAATAAFWALRLSAAAPVVPPGASTAEGSAAAKGDLLRLFGAAPVQQAAVVSVPAESTRFRLAGVVAPRPPVVASSRNGVALIVVDGKPARAYRVGARVDGDWVLQSVSLRSATVGASSGATGFLLEMPPLQAPATGSLPALYPGSAGPPGFPATPARHRPRSSRHPRSTNPLRRTSTTCRPTRCRCRTCRRRLTQVPTRRSGATSATTHRRADGLTG